MGLEFRFKEVNVSLGPAVGGLGKIVLEGRNWESFSNDSYLPSQRAAESVKGIQEVGITASFKHLIANEQEDYRDQGKDGARQTVEAISSNLDDRTLHEYYLWSFYDAVKVGTGNVMCSFNRVNNSYAWKNIKLMNGILKTELGFGGFVVSDWLAQHACYDSAVSSLDMVMPPPFGFWGSNLIFSVRNKSMPGSRLDDMVTQILATWYKMGQDSAPFPTHRIGMPFDLSQPHVRAVDARNTAADRIILRSAIEGHMLVKNTNKTMFPEPGFLTGWNVGFENFLDNFDYFYKINNGEMDVGRPSQIPANVIVLGGGGAGVVMQVATLALFFINAYSAEVYDRPGLHDDFSITPRYDFGFGLSYTKFDFANLVIANEHPRNSGSYPTDPIKPDRRVDLWDHYLTVTVEVTNTSQREGQEVCQLYLGILSAPVKQLRDFEKVDIKIGETRTVKFKLTTRDLSVWDKIAQERKAQSGKHLI